MGCGERCCSLAKWGGICWFIKLHRVEQTQNKPTHTACVRTSNFSRFLSFHNLNCVEDCVDLRFVGYFNQHRRTKFMTLCTRECLWTVLLARWVQSTLHRYVLGVFAKLRKAPVRASSCLYLFFLMFMGPCIANIFQYMSNKMQLYRVYLYLETALHVSGVTSTHHQERIQLYLQASVICHIVTATCRYRGWIGRVGTPLR